MAFLGVSDDVCFNNSSTEMSTGFMVVTQLQNDSGLLGYFTMRIKLQKDNTDIKKLIWTIFK
jgi:hypothetical protein